MQYVIFDIDGTIANNNHRYHYMTGEKKDRAGFLSKMAYDEPIQSVITLIQIIFKSRSPLVFQIILVTGRSERYRGVTQDWLEKYQVPYYKLLMRRDNDHRKDWDIKEEILQTLIKQFGKKPVFVVDDRQQVVDLWRRHDIICLQPNVAIEF